MHFSGSSTTAPDELKDRFWPNRLRERRVMANCRFAVLLCTTDSGPRENLDRILLDGPRESKLSANSQGGSSGSTFERDLKAPKFEKLVNLLSGFSAQAGLDEAIQALVQLKSKKKGGEQMMVRRTRTRRTVRKVVQSGAKLSARVVLGRILKGRLALIIM